MRNRENRLYLSHVSVWEMQLKFQKGKLFLRNPLADIIAEQSSRNGLNLLPIGIQDIFGLGQLPGHHSDPFDRLILSQALRRGFSVVTDDDAFHKYGVSIVW